MQTQRSVIPSTFTATNTTSYSNSACGSCRACTELHSHSDWYLFNARGSKSLRANWSSCISTVKQNGNRPTTMTSTLTAMHFNFEPLITVDLQYKFASILSHHGYRGTHTCMYVCMEIQTCIWSAVPQTFSHWLIHIIYYSLPLQPTSTGPKHMWRPGFLTTNQKGGEGWTEYNLKHEHAEAKLSYRHYRELMRRDKKETKGEAWKGVTEKTS